MDRSLVYVLLLWSCRSDQPPVPSPPGDARREARDALHVDAPALDAAIDAPVDTSHGAIVRVKHGPPNVFAHGVALPTGKTIYVWLYDEPWPCDRPVSEGPQRYVAFEVPVGARRALAASITVKGFLEQPVPESQATMRMMVLQHLDKSQLVIERTGRRRGERLRGTLAGQATGTFGHVDVSGNFDVELCRDASP